MTLWDALLADANDRTAHATLIDPASSSASEAAKIAEVADRAGTDLFLLGGSTDVTEASVQDTLDAVRDAAKAPVILFPSAHTQLARGLDGILFTVAFNSTRPECIIEEQAMGAGPALAAGLDIVTTAYVIVEPGMTVGEVIRADLLTRDADGQARAQRYAELACALRFDAIYLEAGSGAPEPVPPALVRAASQAGVATIVGGGIRTPQAALTAAKAGASMVVTGTLAEDGELDTLDELIRALSSGP